MIVRPLAPPRRRPLWVVAALCVLSLGIYIPVWFGLSWAELRRELKDPRMTPAGHALSLFVPGYGYWQVHRHFAVLESLLAKTNAKRRVDALSATLGFVVWSITLLHYSTEPLFVLLDAVELTAGTLVVIYGQRALNAYWVARPGDVVPERVAETDWLAMAAAAFYFVTLVLGLAAGPTN